MSIQIARPLMLLLIPLIIGLLVFSMRYLYVKSKSAKIKQIIIRAVVATLLVLSLAGISLMQTSKMVTTIFVLDVSDSVSEHEDEIVETVNKAISDKGKDDYVGIVAFGAEAAVENFVSDSTIFNEIQSTVKASATDLEAAVNLALSLMPEDSAKRIVLMTDGAENSGSLKNTISSVISQKCEVKIMKFTTNTDSEVFVSDITVPESVGTGEYFNITVDIESNISTNATVSLYLGHTLKNQQNVKLQKGLNTFVFRDSQSEEGMKNYRVMVEAEGDTLSINNEFSAYTNISVKKPLLVIEGKAGKGEAFSKILDSIGIDYHMTIPESAPGSLSDMLAYSAVIFVDVYADTLKHGFTDNLEAYVRDYGGGFAVCGGRDSYGLGEYKDTAIETVLPVNMEFQRENEIPVTAVQLVIDRSGSMSHDLLALAKEAASASVDNLRNEDYIGVIAFDDHNEKIVPLQLATDRDSIKNRIQSITVGGGTSIYPAVVAAVEELAANTSAKSKHIILLTDGQDSYDNSAYAKIIETIGELGITLSAVGIGSGCNTELLTMLTEECDGRFYFTDMGEDIPKIFAQEILLSVSGYLVNEEFVPTICANDPLIDQVVAQGMPSLYGYIATSTKTRATQLLKTSLGDPLLAYWQYGLGRTVAWTSDVTGNWSGNWSGWENNALLWHNLIQYITEDNKTSGSYAEVEQEGTKAVIKYYTEDFNSKTEVEATVVDDYGNTEVITLMPVAPGEYEGRFDMLDTGVYSVGVKQTEDGEIVGSAITAGIMQYSPEYRFKEAGTLLEEYASAVNGKMISLSEEIFEDSLQYVRGMKDISTVLMVLAAFIFIFDIANRRFRFNVLGRIKDRISVLKEKKAEKKALKTNVAETAKAAQPEVPAAPENKPEVKKKPEKVKKNKKEKEKTEPERLDTSQLLGRMKK